MSEMKEGMPSQEKNKGVVKERLNALLKKEGYADYHIIEQWPQQDERPDETFYGVVSSKNDYRNSITINSHNGYFVSEEFQRNVKEEPSATVWQTLEEAYKEEFGEDFREQ